MNYKQKITYFLAGTLVGATLASIASYYYVDNRIKQAEAKYDQQVQQGFENARIEIKTGVDRISSELETRINEEINKVRKQFGLPEEPIK